MRKATVAFLVGAASVAPTAEAVSIDWADARVSSSFVGDPDSVLGAPDNLFANWGANPGSATYAYTGGEVAYDSTGLAALLGLAPATLGAGNFLVFEANGSAGLGFEGSRWSFDDGSSVFDYEWIEGSVAAGPVVGAGTLSFAAYAAFFGLTPLTVAGDMAFLLFDVPVDVSSPSFQVTLTSSRVGRDAGTPDPDAMGLMVRTPEPSSWALMALALAGVAALGRRRR